MSVAYPAPLASFAVHVEDCRGRLHDEPESQTRSPFQRDRDRVIHSVSFRRLKHKTQVFVYHEGDHYRTRLTHSLEVSQVARSLARMLKLDEDLAECMALAHDLGHPPFGHTGEDVLKECMEGFGGFDHNAQTLRLLTRLERRHAAFDGLNLTWETLEGVVKHNGPLTGPLAEHIAKAKGKPLESLPVAIQEYATHHDLMLQTFPSLEAQVSALADDIAYNNHDVDDGLRAGLFSLEEASDVPLVGEAIAASREKYPNAPEDLLIAEAVSDMIGAMVADVYAETNRRLAKHKPKTAMDVRIADEAMVAFSEGMQAKVTELRAFLFARMYRHYKVNRARSYAKRVVRDLFQTFVNEPETLPPSWKLHYPDANGARLHRIVCDYIAGMTDRYAYREHKRLFSADEWL